MMLGVTHQIPSVGSYIYIYRAIYTLFSDSYFMYAVVSPHLILCLLNSSMSVQLTKIECNQAILDPNWTPISQRRLVSKERPSKVCQRITDFQTVKLKPVRSFGSFGFRSFDGKCKARDSISVRKRKPGILDSGAS